MARGMMNRGGGGGNNMNSLMKQAQKMQMEMQKTQQAIEEQIFEGVAGGGAVKVEFTGKKKIQSLSIEKDVVDPDDVEMLEDLIIAAINQATEKIDNETESKMGKLTGGMKIPGL